MSGEDHERHLPLWQHLEELRRAMLKMLAAVGVGMVLSLVFINPVLDMLMRPLARVADEMGVVLNQASPFDAVLIKFKVGVLVGLVLSMPVILGLLWGFVAPGLRGREKQLGWWFCGGGGGLFLLGVTLGFLALGQIMPILAGFSIAGAANIWALRAYFDFLFYWLLATGLACELPLVLVALVRLDILTPADLRRARPVAVVAIFVVAALTTPPDPVTQLMLAIPLWLLYEVGILLGGIGRARRECQEKE